jgi:hypothetical protein
LILDNPSAFSGTVAGLAAGDNIDLPNLAFGTNPIISNVTGSGAIGTTTNVTVADGATTFTLQLLNQYAGQFAVDASAYTLRADNQSATPGTLFQLAAPH